jgi:adenylosuccinate synthase
LNFCSKSIHFHYFCGSNIIHIIHSINQVAVDILLGLQWGDEGKGKIVDVVASQYEVVARFQGGPNAGHTLVINGVKHVLHQIPSGIFHPKTQNIIGNGVVLDIVVLLDEIKGLQAKGVNVVDNLFISKKAQLIIPTHRLLDAASEQQKGEKKIGSTLRGIGPAYQDKYARQALRVGDILSDNFNNLYEQLKARHIEQLKHYSFDYDEAALKERESLFFGAVEAVKQLQLVNTEYLLNAALKQGKSILAEGAQGTLLDVDFGSYPYVTSSNTIAAGACTGLGIPPHAVKEVFAIFKAYCTRVGSGPFPTELHEEVGERIRVAGNEFGSTTGRPRRCGWLDLPALNYAVMLNGATKLLMMKADVLEGFEEVKICTAYQLADGTVTTELPYDICYETITPIYESLAGWGKIDAVSNVQDLPQNLKKYIQYIEEKTGVPVALVSYGPDRSQTVGKV